MYFSRFKLYWYTFDTSQHSLLYCLVFHYKDTDIEKIENKRYTKYTQICKVWKNSGALQVIALKRLARRWNKLECTFAWGACLEETPCKGSQKGLGFSICSWTALTFNKASTSLSGTLVERFPWISRICSLCLVSLSDCQYTIHNYCHSDFRRCRDFACLNLCSWVPDSLCSPDVSDSDKACPAQRWTFVQIAVLKPQAAQAAEMTTPEAKMKTRMLTQLRTNRESWENHIKEIKSLCDLCFQKLWVFRLNSGCCTKSRTTVLCFVMLRTIS